MFRNRSCLSKQSLPIIVLCAMAFLLTPLAHSEEIYPPYPFEIIEKGNAKEALQKYEADAIKLESEGKLERAAILYRDASWLARQAGNYQKGILCGTKAIELSEKGNYPLLQAQALIQTAKSYFVIADYEKALRLFEKAVTLASRLDMKGLEAKCNQEIGNIYGKLSSPEKALEYQKKAYDYYKSVMTILEEPAVTGRRSKQKRNLSEQGRMMNLTDSLISMGDNYTKLNDYKSASEFLNKALYYASGIKEKTLRTYLSMGDMNYKKRDYHKALEYHKKACQLSDAVNSPFYTVRAYSKAAKDYEAMKQPEEAVNHYRKAIDSIEDQRSLLQSEDMRSSFFEQMVNTYDNMISTLIALGKPEDAFNFSERVRSRTFLDILGSKVDLSRGKASALTDKEREFKARMSALQIKLNNSEGDDNEINQEINELKKEYSHFLEKLRREDSEHASLVSVNPLTLKDIQVLLERDKTIVEFHVLKDKVIAWVVKKDSMHSVEISKSRKEILDKAKNFRESIADVSSEQRVKAASQDLYSTLFRDIDIPKGERLIIVPHDLLHYLPFQCLVTPEGRYLIEDHEISYLSSASLLQFTSHKRKKAGDDVLAFGNPDVGNPAYDLIYAEREVKEIAVIYPNSEIYVRKQATKSRAKEKSPGHSMLHFATHNQFNEENPIGSSLKMASEAANNGDFTTEEVFRLNLNASLVVLSACETALGKISSGDEIIGFNRAFIYAGAPSVVTTLWAVDDKATFLLMEDFYRNLKTGSKGSALRTAQVNLMKKYHHPFYWGAFILTGDPE